MNRLCGSGFEPGAQLFQPLHGRVESVDHDGIVRTGGPSVRLNVDSQDDWYAVGRRGPKSGRSGS